MLGGGAWPLCAPNKHPPLHLTLESSEINLKSLVVYRLDEIHDK